MPRKALRAQIESTWTGREESPMKTDAARGLLGGAAITLMLTISTAAFAQPWQWGDGNIGPGHGFMGRADSNDDGRISADEAAAAAESVFIAMDADDDGRITPEEYMALRMGFGRGWNAERQATMQAQKEARFAEMDADQDGAVSREEFMNAARDHHAAADTDGDGAVTPWEHRMQKWF